MWRTAVHRSGFEGQCCVTQLGSNPAVKCSTVHAFVLVVTSCIDVLEALFAGSRHL